MSCQTNDCGDAPVAGTGAFAVSTPRRSCTGGGICADGYEGLPYANQVDLVGVPEGDRCLHRLNAAKGIWQHDPDRPGGADYVGPLSGGISFTPGENLGEGECGYSAILKEGTNGAVELVKQDVAERSDGELAVIQQCSGGKQRTDVLTPEDFDEDNPCEENLSLLGWVNQTVVVNGIATVRKVWKQLTRLLFPSSQLTEFEDIDYTAAGSDRRAVWREVGGCMELGVAEPDEANPSGCADLPSAGTTFQYLIGCKDGVESKVEPTAGFSLVGDGSNWQSRQQGPKMVTRVSIFSQSGSGPVVTSTLVDLSAIAGYDANATHVYLDLYARGTVISSDYLASIDVEGVSQCELELTAAFQGQSNNNQILVEIPANKTITIAISKTVQTVGADNNWVASVWVAGFYLR